MATKSVARGATARGKVLSFILANDSCPLRSFAMYAESVARKLTAEG